MPVLVQTAEVLCLGRGESLLVDELLELLQGHTLVIELGFQLATTGG